MRINAEELLRRYATGERDFADIKFSARLLDGEDLREINLSGADLIRVDLSGTNLRNANLSGARLICANLTAANLEGANLFGADLSGADCIGTNFRDADLSETILSGTDFTGADLYGVEMDNDSLHYSSGQKRNFARQENLSFLLKITPILIGADLLSLGDDQDSYMVLKIP
ncbi:MULTISPECIES: pentapeptide repeat-containing protein [Nostocales]|uniref:Pentapeptide repeat-containing protein n=3 Tax=Nostocales TaxID=1161 RepID=A0A8S9TF32_9CYAN|nr:pentapeptide repeat-containing protein [Tolypothrix bouteillei]KAF3890232.1 pentapeptide repeat-containing protein [Tolypothrix bouteillei VB521301]